MRPVIAKRFALLCGFLANYRRSYDDVTELPHRITRETVYLPRRK